MPCEARRVVVLSQETYQRLKDSSIQIQPEESLQSSSKEYTPPPAINIPLVVDRGSSPIKAPLDQVSVQEQPEKKPTEELFSLETFPKPFQKGAKQLLEQLEAAPSISWNQVTGLVYVRGKDQNITIGDLIKAVCIPFTATQVPPACSALLKELDIKPRNHLINAPKLPAWHPYFKF